MTSRLQQISQWLLANWKLFLSLLRPACPLLSLQEHFTESQNHRMVGVGSDLCGSSSPTLLPKQGHLQQAAQDLVQAGLEYLQRRRLHSLPGQPVPELRHPQREEILPHVQMELPVPQFVPIAPCPVTGHHWKELGPILLTPTLQIWVSSLEFQLPAPCIVSLFPWPVTHGSLSKLLTFRHLY